MATRTPHVAVVIATARRETRLAFALDALAEQTLPRDRFEVVVVRAQDAGAKTQAPPGLRVRFLTAAPDSGPAEKRNIGWRATAAPLVAFTDDDCRPAPEWLEKLLEAAAREHRGNEPFLLQGRTEPDPEERRHLHGLALSQRIVGPSPWYETCNVAYPRGLLERLGGFDERFAGRDPGEYPVGGEDTDLGLRALAAGARTEFVEDAVVRHAVHPRHLRRAVRDTRRWRSVPAVLARHPQQRRVLHARLFGRRAHMLVLLAAFALPLRRQPAVALLLSAPYLDYHLRGYERSARGVARAALDLPARAAVDAIEVGVTAAGALRHRVPVL